MSEWQPIDTAPKGCRLIVANKHWFGPATELDDGMWLTWFSFFEPFNTSQLGRDCAPNCIRPTHWMLPPNPPATEKETA